ncbi:unnamed protein product, partial [Allacma fusca]
STAFPKIESGLRRSNEAIHQRKNLFLKKLFASPPEGIRGQLWKDIWELPSYNDNYVNNLVENCGSNLFTPSMKFSSLDVKTHFVTAGFPELIGIIIFNLFDIFA